MRWLWIFVDGLGLGPATATNPLAATPLPTFERLLDGASLTAERLAGQPRWTGSATTLDAADATFGHEDIPQSATGQIALLTGADPIRCWGRPFGPWVPTALRPWFLRANLLRRLRLRGRRVTWLHALRVHPRRRPPAFPLAVYSARLPPPATPIPSGDFRGIDPAALARTVLTESRGADLAVLVHYGLDLLAHRGPPEALAEALRAFDDFLGALLALRPPDLAVLLTSDHGHIEQPGHGHTRHPVPVLWIGSPPPEPTTSLAAVAPTLGRALGVEVAPTNDDERQSRRDP
ncbi:MAG TPA: hypothetical protein VIN09_11800 [Chloroflexota bacterium]